jgi:hypothetical protein
LDEALLTERTRRQTNVNEETGDFDPFRNDWSLFKPKSNVYWLHYLVGKLRNNAHYEDKTSSTHQSNLKKLKDFEDEIMDHESCAAFAMSQSKYIRREG